MTADKSAPQTIDVLVPEDTRGWFSTSEPVSVETLGDNMQKFVAGLDTALNRVPSALVSYDLDKVEVSVSVSAEGSVSLLGTGGKAGMEGGLKLTFSRKTTVAGK
jgi:hypothetical protein